MELRGRAGHPGPHPPLRAPGGARARRGAAQRHAERGCAGPRHKDTRALGRAGCSDHPHAEPKGSAESPAERTQGPSGTPGGRAVGVTQHARGRPRPIPTWPRLALCPVCRRWCPLLPAISFLLTLPPTPPLPPPAPLSPPCKTKPGKMPARAARSVQPILE